MSETTKVDVPSADNTITTTEILEDCNSVARHSAVDEVDTSHDIGNDAEPTKPPPKVRWKVEYRDIVGEDFLFADDVTEKADKEKRLKPLDGPIFEVCDVNYIAESQAGNKKDSDEISKTERRAVRNKGRQYIRIFSPSIINALQSVVNYYPSVIHGDTVCFSEPYALLVHHREELEAFRENFHPNKANETPLNCVVPETYEHLGYLLEFLEEKNGEKVRKETSRWSREVPTASYEMLWLLLKPGIDVYYDVDGLGTREPWVISDVSWYQLNGSWSQYVVKLWNLQATGIMVQPKYTTHYIQRYHGEKPISKLEMFPCEYLDGHEARKAELVTRGKMFFHLRRKRCMYFDGRSNSFPYRHFKGYVMCDDWQYGRDHDQDMGAQFLPTPDAQDHGPVVDTKPSGLPICECERCSSIDSEQKKPSKFDGYTEINPYEDTELTEHQYFISARSTFAFIFKLREWANLLITGFQEPHFDTKLVDLLVLKPHIKDTIIRLTKTFIEKMTTIDDGKPQDHSDSIQPPRWSADFIESKGNGLIFLLHGKPGVGKTYTAECIAEHLSRPLLPVTSSDIGVDPAIVENKLTEWFKIAKNWGAILLLDEADIYMEYRQIHDLTRNNLVASFLRAIEYYEGILFLTTNRVGHFDEAFLSRITVSIYYPDFSDKEREEIWNNYFEKIADEAADQFYIPEATKEYAMQSSTVVGLKWNGREIRNAFQIAVNLAQSEGAKDSKGRVVIKRDHIKATAELSMNFKEYMTTLHTKDEGQLAQIRGNRYDAFGSQGAAKEEYI